MTRENKLALVLGFGFILLVGILVSDHFSPARLEAAEDLRGNADPGIAGRTSAWRPHRVEAGTTDAAATPDDRPTPDAAAAESAGRPEPTPASPRRTAEDAAPDRAMPQPPAGPAGLEPGRVHRVVAGDTLERIARREYSDTGLVDALARYNRIDDPASIRVGQSLDLPPAEVLRQGTAARRTDTRDAEPAAAPSRPWVYVVQEHDTLSGIAVANLGTAKAWTTILQLNRDILPDERSLRPGQKLRMPPREP
jgi:nucleoid-associated protein YgaU